MTTKSSKIKVSELQDGDVIKITMAVQIVDKKSLSTTFGSINDVAALSSLFCSIDEGPFKGKTAMVTANNDDKFEVIMRAKRTPWYVTLYISLFGK